jgi:hypothetical protein
MPVPPTHLKDLIEGTVDHHASVTFPNLQEVTVRWRGSFGYLIAWAGEGDDDDEQVPLYRIEYLGDDEDWGFAIYDPDLHPGHAPHRAAHRAPQRRLRHRRHHPPRRLPAVNITHLSNQ